MDFAVKSGVATPKLNIPVANTDQARDLLEGIEKTEAQLAKVAPWHRSSSKE